MIHVRPFEQDYLTPVMRGLKDARGCIRGLMASMAVCHLQSVEAKR